MRVATGSSRCNDPDATLQQCKPFPLGADVRRELSPNDYRASWNILRYSGALLFRLNCISRNV